VRINVPVKLHVAISYVKHNFYYTWSRYDTRHIAM